MKNDPLDPSPLAALLHDQREAFLRNPFPSWEQRAGHLRALRAALLGARTEISAAIHADFGNRPTAETEIAELFPMANAIRHALRHGRRWMRPERRSAGLELLPARASLIPQPLGVIGIIAPWNYPLMLSVGPLVCALAAGNRALIKPSEFTPAFAGVLERIIAATFARDHVALVQGDAELAKTFALLPFDHLIFTGSSAVGRQVMRSAAENLTPVTLELGGKSPAIIGPGARFDHAVDAIINGKTLNAGQTCIAPDYVLLPRGSEPAFIERARRRIARLYPDISRQADTTSIQSARHFARLQGLADDALAAGATLHPLADSASFAPTRQFAPLAVTGVDDSMRVMHEEIFGPLLPLVPYDRIDEAINYVNRRARPLALYLFDENRATVNEVLRRTISGGVTVNDTLLHILADDLPFGGVGPSGLGAYHGREGFRAMSHMKPVLKQSRINGRWLVTPPYGRRVAMALRFLIR